MGPVESVIMVLGPDALGRRVLVSVASLSLAGFTVGQAAAAPARPVLRFLSLPATSSALTEGSVAVEPGNPSHLAVLAVDYDGYVVTVPVSGEGTRIGPICRLFESRDGGQHWVTSEYPMQHLPDAPYLDASNPSLAISRGGRLHATCLPNNSVAGGAITYASAQAGQRLTAMTFPLSTPAVGPVGQPDKPWITVAPNGQDVTVAWTLFPTNPGYALKIVSRTSRDGGASFGAPAVVSPVTADAASLPTPLYTRDGQLVVAWHQTKLDPNGATSTDSVQVSVNAGAPVTVLPSIAPSGVQDRYPRHTNQPSLAQDPLTGRLYLTAGEQTAGGVRSVVAFSDDGTHWSPPQIIAPTPAGDDQLNAALAVTPGGTVGLLQQDVRNNVLTTWLNTRTRTRNAWTRILLSRRPTLTVPYTQANNGTPIGDYLTMAASSGQLLPVWPEGLSGRLQLRMAAARVA